MMGMKKNHINQDFSIQEKEKLTFGRVITNIIVYSFFAFILIYFPSLVWGITPVLVFYIAVIIAYFLARKKDKKEQKQKKQKKTIVYTEKIEEETPIKEKEKLTFKDILGYIIVFTPLVLTFVILPILKWGWKRFLIICFLILMAYISNKIFKNTEPLVSLESMSGLNSHERKQDRKY